MTKPPIRPASSIDQSHPRMSIGLPVYNGAKYLRETLQSLLGQTFADLELIISDNASTDETQAICREFAAADERVRYCRGETNRGAAWNYNRVLELARGEYFKWAAHDDLLAPGFVAACIDVLDRDKETVLCHTHCTEIDAAGNHRDHDYNDALSRLDPARRPAARFECVLNSRFAWMRVFGVIRLDVLRQTLGIAPFVASDLVLMAELSLRGRLAEVPEELFLRRFHAETSIQAFRERRKRLVWFDGREGRITCLPEWRLNFEYLKVVLWRTPVAPHVRLACAGHLFRKAAGRWRALALDLVWAAQDIGGHLRQRFRAPLSRTATEASQS